MWSPPVAGTHAACRDAGTSRATAEAGTANAEPERPNRPGSQKRKVRLTVFELRNTDCVLATERYHIICRSTPLLDLERCELKLA